MSSARLRVGTVSLAHVAEAELAVLTPPGTAVLACLRCLPMVERNGVKAAQRNGVEPRQSSESGANGGRPVPRDWKQQARGSGRRGKSPITFCRLRRWASRSALLKTGLPVALVGSRRQTRGRDSSEPRSGEFGQNYPRSGHLCVPPRAPEDLWMTGRVDCNGDFGTPRRVNRARGSESAADPGLRVPVKAARCAPRPR